jgi:hypothetical protein
MAKKKRTEANVNTDPNLTEQPGSSDEAVTETDAMAKEQKVEIATVKLNPKRNSKGAEYICQWIEDGEPKSVSVGFDAVDVPESSQQLQEGLNNQTLQRA